MFATRLLNWLTMIISETPIPDCIRSRESEQDFHTNKSFKLIIITMIEKWLIGSVEKLTFNYIILEAILLKNCLLID